MSEFPDQLPGGSGSAVSVSDSDPVVEADELAFARIRNMCAVAIIGAESISQSGHIDIRRLNRLRFASAKRMSLELTKTISDASCRDVALRYIIELRMNANDTESSTILLRSIQSEAIREELFLTYPSPFH